MSLAVRTAIIQEDICLVAGDSNDASWRRKTGLGQLYDSTLQEAFKNAKLPVPTPLWSPGGFFQVNGLTCAGLSTPQTLKQRGSYASTVHLKLTAKSWVSLQKDQAHRCETWIHLSDVSTPIVERERERRLDHSRRGGRKRKSYTSQRWTVHPLTVASRVRYK